MTMKAHLEELRGQLKEKDVCTCEDAVRIVDAMVILQTELEVLLERVQSIEARLAPESPSGAHPVARSDSA